MSESWLTEFETRLERLERAAPTGEISFAELLEMANVALSTLVATTEVRHFLVRPDSVESISVDGRTVPAAVADRSIVADAAGREFVIEESASGQPTAPVNTLYVSSRLAEQLTFVMATEYGQLHCGQSGFVEGSRAVADLLAAFVSRHLLSQYESRLNGQFGLTDLVSRLYAANSLQQAANVVAQDGAAVLGRCRLSVLTRQDGRLRVRAVTGVAAPDGTSESVQALERIADSLNTNDSLADDPAAPPTWVELSALRNSASAALTDCLSILESNGTTQLRIESLAAPAAGGIPPGTAETAVIVELFHDSVLPDEHLYRQLVNGVRQPLEHHRRKEQPFLNRLITTRSKRWGLGLLIGVLALILIPVRFEVEVPGQILAANQRHIFAPEDGTIDEVLFSNESFVVANALLLRMSNSDLELQLKQVQGDLDTTTSQLSAAEIDRQLNSSAAPNGDELQLKKKQINLQEQLKLLETQSQALEILAPFAGTVFRPDPQQELRTRPVQRGQRLLEIVPENPQWRLRLSIPGHLLTYVAEHYQTSKEPVDIRYMIQSAPEENWTTELTTLENAVQVENSKAVCHANAELVDVPGVHLRPGTSATARIACGYRSLGFVTFREVIEFWRQLQFTWF